MTSRKQARDSLYKLVYEYLFLKEPNEKSLGIFMSDSAIKGEDLEYMKSAYYGIIENHDALIEIVDSFKGKFSLERIFKPDLSALLVAIYEMKFTNIPHSVSISEAIELVKTYSTEQSNKYVNGILASVFKMLNPQENT